MNGRDAFSEELLSAYLDGEVSGEERRYVEQMLEESPEIRARYRAFCGLGQQLAVLSRYTLRHEVSARVLNAIEDAEDTRAADQANPGFAAADEEWLNAYVDGELNAVESEQVEQELRQNEEQRQLVAGLRDLHEQIAALPRYRLDDSFADRVLQQLQSHASATPTDLDAPTPALAAAGSRGRSVAGGWRGVIWAAAAIAAAVMLMVLTRGNGLQDDPWLAMPHDEPPVESPHGELDNHLATGTQDGPPEQPLLPGAAPPMQSPLMMVSSLRQAKLVLVYEIAVTEKGVANAAFANLLRRHEIGFNETVVVSPPEQEDLLAHRFLENVHVVDDRRQKMDRVELFLVATTARSADAMYVDLMSRPAGIGGFALNLTSRDAHDRVLNRLCESSGVEDNVGQAVKLLANFGVLSSTARNLGAFGTIRWVDPSLYQPTEPRRGSATGDLVPVDDAEAILPGADGAMVQQPAPVPQDFTCELLFVVRQCGLMPDAVSAD